MSRNKVTKISTAILDKIHFIDSLLTLSIFSYLLLWWAIIISTYSHIFYSLAIISLIGLVLLSFGLDFLLYFKKKAFLLQIFINFLIISLYLFVFILFLLISFGSILIGFFIFPILIIFKSLRIYSIIKTKLTCRRENINTRLTFRHLKTYKFGAIVLFVIFLVPLAVVLLGLTPYTVAVVEIDVNDQLGDNKGSEEIQLSFYATMSSYDYLTNETVLKALNGTNFGDGELSPVEVLLLVSDSQLLHKTDKVQLADMVKNCTNSNLDVWVWFVYDEVKGHYPAYENHEYMAEFKDLFDEWVSNYSLNIHGILFDNEMDDFINHLPADNVLTYLDGVLSHRQKVRQDWEDAVESYRTAAEDWKDQGYEIALVGMETSILDNSDGDPDIQQMYGIVNNPPDVWERVSFMFYRSCEYHNAPYGEDYLFNLARRHAETFGERAVVAIGCMGFESYDETDEIVKDIAILKYLGYSTVELFELGAFYREFGYEGLLPVLNSSLKGWKYPEFTIKFYTVEYMSRTLLFLADILLNLF